MRYEVDGKGTWRPVGRYDVGFYDRTKEGAPYMRANCAGGIAFGLGYDEQSGSPTRASRTSSCGSTGDKLCSPRGSVQPADRRQHGTTGSEAPQKAAAQGRQDGSEVSGMQGLAEGAFEELAPESAFAPVAARRERRPRPNQAYMIDTDVNVDGDGRIIEQELTRNDATKIGDVAIYQMCEPPKSYAFAQWTPPACASDRREPCPPLLPWPRRQPLPLRLARSRTGAITGGARTTSTGATGAVGSHSRERSHWRHCRRTTCGAATSVRARTPTTGCAATSVALEQPRRTAQPRASRLEQP